MKLIFSLLLVTFSWIICNAQSPVGKWKMISHVSSYDGQTFDSHKALLTKRPCAAKIVYEINAEGSYTVNVPNGSTASTYQNVAQFANLTASNYLCGGLLQGSQLTISVSKVSKSPQIVEATFSGTMQCVEGNIVSITEGKFSYHE